MTTTVNRETINDRFKLAFHRVVARRLKGDPELLDEARSVVRGWASDGRPGDYVSEWDALMSRSVGDVRKVIVGRDENMKRLRVSSPFSLLADRIVGDEGRTKLWRIVKKPFAA